MTHQKKRPQIREPLTEEEESSGQTYYSDADIEAVLKTFKAKPDLDLVRFRDTLERAANWYVNRSNAMPDPAASDRKEHWKEVEEAITDLHARIKGLDGRRFQELLEAAEQIARQEGVLPDFSPDHTPLPPTPDKEGEEPHPRTIKVWPVEEQINKILSEILWLRRCAAYAGQAAADSSTGRGNKPDEARHLFYQTCISLFGKSAADPDKPRRGGSGDIKGQVIDFLEACLSPLDVPDSRSAIYGMHRRFKKKQDTIAFRARNRPEPDTP